MLTLLRELSTKKKTILPTQTYYFSGEFLFPHLVKPDTKFDTAGSWHISVILDDESKAAYAASGMQVKPKVYNDRAYIKFSRPAQKVIKGELVKFDKPGVINADGSPVDVFVGNGSKGTVKVIVYDTMKGKGHRMEMVKVTELIEYKPEPKAEATGNATTAAAIDAAKKSSIPF